MNKRLPNFLNRAGLLSVLLALFLAGTSRAQTPTYAYSPSSVGTNVFPLGQTATNQVQWLFQAGDFTPTSPIGVFMHTIYIKAGNTYATGGTFTNLQIKIGTTTQTCLTSGTWNGGLGTVYFSTSASISSWTTNGWVQIVLNTPYLYTGANFILEISQQGLTNPMYLQQGTISGCNRRMWGPSSSSSSSGADGSLLSFGFDTSPANCAGTPQAPIVSTAAVPAATPHCAGATKVLTATDPNQPINGMAYQWQTATASTGPWTNVTTGSGATTLTYTTGPITANTYFRIGATCINSSITTYSSPYLIPLGSTQPGTITGASTYCPGDPEQYSVPAVPGGTFTWTLPPGWTGFSNSNTITVTPGPGTAPATIAVAVTTPCGPISIQRTRTIAPGSAPSPPGTIAGNTHICGNTSQTYTVLPVGGAMYYTWTLPSGWVGTSTTNTITATAAASGTGNITVRAVNGCGQSTANTLPVTVIAALPNPGTITGSDTVCSGSLLTYSINPVPGATSYTWTLPSGWSGTTTGTSIQTFAGSASGTLRVTAYVSCATSPISLKSVAVVTSVNPAVVVSVPSTTLCQGSIVTITATPSFPGSNPTYQWKKNGVNVTAFGNTYTTNTLLKGDSVSVTMTSSASCASNPTAASNTIYPNITPSVTPGISINTVPPINICEGTSVTFTTVSNGGGSGPVYQWYKNALPIGSANSTTYTDAALNDGDTITVGLTSNAVCAVTNNAASNKVGVTVIPSVPPTVTVSVSPTEYIYTGQPLTFSATHTNGGAAPDFQWQKNGVDIPFETGDSYMTSSLQPGDHINVRMLSYAPCVDPELVSSNIIILKSNVGVGSVGQIAASLNLYPNPNSGRFTLSTANWDAALVGKQMRIDVINAVGQSVHLVEFSPSSTEWKTQLELGSGLASGRYMLRLSSIDGGYRTTLPFVLNR